MYIDPSGQPISQGDILDDCPLFGLDPTDDKVDVNSDPQRWFARVILLTQACDLSQVKTIRVVVAVVHNAQQLVDSGVLKASLIRDRVRRHQVYGWYFLPESEALGLPESLVDLRNLHTIPRTVLKRIEQNGGRLGRVETPYREHLNQHFAQTYARIALPEPYETKEQT